MERIAQSLRLLGDETRLRLLRLLSEQALNVSELNSSDMFTLFAQNGF